MAKRRIAAFVLGMYSLVVALVTVGKPLVVIPGLWRARSPRVRRVELNPLADFLNRDPWWGPYADTAANIALFLPVGMLLAAMMPQRSPGRLAAGCAVASCAIEVTQYVGRLGWSDINDVVFNTAGAFLGAVLIRRGKVSGTAVIAATFLLSLGMLALISWGSTSMVLAAGSQNVSVGNGDS